MQQDDVFKDALLKYHKEGNETVSCTSETAKLPELFGTCNIQKLRQKKSAQVYSKGFRAFRLQLI